MSLFVEVLISQELCTSGCKKFVENWYYTAKSNNFGKRCLIRIVESSSSACTEMDGLTSRRGQAVRCSGVLHKRNTTSKVMQMQAAQEGTTSQTSPIHRNSECSWKSHQGAQWYISRRPPRLSMLPLCKKNVIWLLKRTTDDLIRVQDCDVATKSAGRRKFEVRVAFQGWAVMCQAGPRGEVEEDLQFKHNLSVTYMRGLSPVHYVNPTRVLGEWLMRSERVIYAMSGLKERLNSRLNLGPLVQLLWSFLVVVFSINKLACKFESIKVVCNAAFTMFRLRFLSFACHEHD